MDNAYYTGATLIRTGNSNGGGSNNSQQSKYSSFSSSGLRTSGSPPIPPSSIHHGTPPPQTQPPLVLQPNLLTGLPLIRNGQHLQAHHPPSPIGHQHGPNGQSQQGPVTPPGVICCIQPIYYIPAPSQPATLYNNSPILLPASTNKQNVVNNNGNFHQTQCMGKPGVEMPKRKNYKSLSLRHMKLKPVQSSPPPLTSGGIQGQDHDQSKDHIVKYQHSKLTGTASYPDPISKPTQHPALTRTTSTNFFTNELDSSSNEEKRRNDKLLNFYFYEKHWRPRDEEEEEDVNVNNNSAWTAGSGQNRKEDTEEDRSWNVIKRPLLQKTLSEEVSRSVGFDRQPGAGRHLSSSPPTLLKQQQHQQQQKDLEVEAQIITLANGHRDLEIRLCYVTS